jgi:GT2 family glycosyltransferase
MTIGDEMRGNWNLVKADVPVSDQNLIYYINIIDGNGRNISGNVYLKEKDAFLRIFDKSQYAVVYFLNRAERLCLFCMGAGSGAPLQARVQARAISRAQASACLLLRTKRPDLSQFLRSAVASPAALPRHLRRLLATTARDVQPARADYAAWLEFFDTWPEGGTSPAAAQVSIAYLVFARDASSPAFEATLNSVAAQDGHPAYAVLDPATGMSPCDAIDRLQADYIGILQAGEVLPRHATRAAARQLEQLGHPEIAITDDDDFGLDGVRENPRMKPTPNHALMLSGTLSRGLWLAKRSTLRDHGSAADWAEELRLSVWLARRRAGDSPFSGRIPYILSHRRLDAEAAPPDVLAAIVARHLDGHGPAILPIATSPLTFRIREGGGSESVTAIVPSTLRKPESLRCIREVLDGTDYPNFDVRVVVMQPDPLDEIQTAAADVLMGFPNVTVRWLEASKFNFSKANNAIASSVTSDHILLLNDDVAPIRPDWLRWMAAFLRDPRVGIVGARLLYPDGTVQHGGVIMGLSGPCDHAHRHLPAAEAGYMGRAVLAQELSAVTAACMLVQRSLYQRLGGLDEKYPSAFNDVDFALRVGETGHEVVYVPQAELYHYESQTYGSHYAGEREAFFEEEVRRMHTRWEHVIAADPFHNPNLARSSGFEWRLAFPPRTEVLDR